MADLFGTLQRLAGSREGCFFDAATPKVDAAVVCHEVRSPGLTPDEKLCVTFRVAGRPEADIYRSIGEMVKLKTLQLDSVVLMSVFAYYDEAKSDERRACGEARIPLRHLVSRCDGALYHSWMMLDSPGFNDSVASIGMLAGGGNDGEAFMQALQNGPRQLFQPKACISICKAEDLGPSGQALWTADAPRQDRITHWGPLLRSQQQHVVMCTAQHLHSAQANRDQRAQTAQRLEALEDEAREQERELEDLRRQLAAKEAEVAAGGRAGKPSLEELERRGMQQLQQSRQLAELSEERAARRGRDGELRIEGERQRDLSNQLRKELEGLQEELAKIGDEANGKIEAANVRIRALRRERDDAGTEVEQQTAERNRLQESTNELSAERDKLNDQKEALLKIVEDLHQTCISAGLPMGTRKTMDSITMTGFKFP